MYAALEELSRQKGGKSKHADDVRDTLQWLDEATTRYPDAVALQGGDETYEKWAEVEKFVVPRTLFSENNHEHELELIESNELSFEAINKLSVSDVNLKASDSSVATDANRSLSTSSLRSALSSASQASPPTSPQKPMTSPGLAIASLNAAASRPQSSSASVPTPLQPLFNYILWRIHQELDPVAALESFIFLCNDDRKVGYAKGFDIKTKRLEQLREAIGREDRDFKNRMALLNRENQASVSVPTEEASPLDSGSQAEKDEDDQEVVFKPPRAPAAMLPKQQPNVIDPNAFERRSQPPSAAVQEFSNGASQSPRARQAQPHRGSPRGNHALPFAPRGNMRGGRGNLRGNPRGRGNFGGRGGHAIANNVMPTNTSAVPSSPKMNGQIDPASFARPEAPRSSRKLWVPT